MPKGDPQKGDGWKTKGHPGRQPWLIVTERDGDVVVWDDLAYGWTHRTPLPFFLAQFEFVSGADDD